MFKKLRDVKRYQAFRLNTDDYKHDKVRPDTVLIPIKLTEDPAEVYCINTDTMTTVEIYEGERVEVLGDWSPSINWTQPRKLKLEKLEVDLY